MYLFVVIKKNRDFIRAYKRGKSVITPCLAFYYLPNKQGITRMGITASKKIGGAVERNRAKRVLRAAFSSVAPTLKPGYDFILVARTRTTYKKSTDVQRELAKALSEHNLTAGAQ